MRMNWGQKKTSHTPIMPTKLSMNSSLCKGISHLGRKIGVGEGCVQISTRDYVLGRRISNFATLYRSAFLLQDCEIKISSYLPRS